MLVEYIVDKMAIKQLYLRDVLQVFILCISTGHTVIIIINNNTEKNTVRMA